MSGSIKEVGNSEICVLLQKSDEGENDHYTKGATTFSSIISKYSVKFQLYSEVGENYGKHNFFILSRFNKV